MSDNPTSRPVSRAHVLLCFSPLLLILAVFSIYGLTGRTLVFCEAVVSGACTPLVAAKPIMESLLRSQPDLLAFGAVLSAGTRYYWITAVAACLGLALVLAGASYYVIQQSTRYFRHRLPLIIIPPIISTVAGLAIMYLLSNLHAGKAPWQVYLHSGVMNDFPIIEPWSQGLDALSIAVALYAALALCIILLPSVRHRTAWAKDFFRHTQNLRMLLYLSSALLAVMVIRVTLFFQFSMSYLPLNGLDRSPEDLMLINAFTNFGNSIATSRGLLYSMIIAAGFVPASLFLRSLAARLDESHQLDHEEWVEWDSHFSMARTASGVAAILMPMVSGPAADILASISAG